MAFNLLEFEKNYKQERMKSADTLLYQFAMKMGKEVFFVIYLYLFYFYIYFYLFLIFLKKESLVTKKKFLETKNLRFIFMKTPSQFCWHFC